MRKKMVAGNWKMHGGLSGNALLLQTLALATRNQSFSAVDVAVFCPFPYLAQTESLLSGSSVSWGAQNVSEHLSGAFTGEVSVSMLRDFACAYVIVGHSERRTLYGETDQQVAAKAARVIEGGLVPVICLGETLVERDSGMTEAVVQRQLAAVIDVLGVSGLAKAVLAYEPVWAIGTGKTASPLQVQEVHLAIRSQMALVDHRCAQAVRILYGGSVKATNAAELFALDDVDGGLVGGASLVPEEFLAICQAACV
jgi:triosephosphate isomerase (TIM)